MASAEHEHDTTDPLRLDRCPECGYSWQGLRTEGLCPECGFACSSDLIVVYGPHGNLLARTTPGRLAWFRRWLVWPWLVPVWIILAFTMLLLTQIFPKLERFPGIVLVIVFAAALSGYRRWRAWREDLAARWQLRLGTGGFAQREFLGPAPLHPWTADLQAFVYIEPWPPLQYAGRQRWPAGKRWVRVQIKGAPHLGDGGLLVDFGFGCEAATARRLQEQVHEWLAAAREAASKDMPQRP